MLRGQYGTIETIRGVELMTPVVFEDNELEIALVTYNRSEFVSEWIDHCYDDIVKRNIKLSIYDSSTNDLTRDLVIAHNSDHNKPIEYHRVDSDTPISHKPIYPIYETKAEYLWVSGDSRYHDFSDLDQAVFPSIKKGLDYIGLWINNNEENDQKVYTDKREFFFDCFITMTCIGMSIYRMGIFKGLLTDKAFKSDCLRKYEKNEWAFIGFFLEAYAMNGKKALFSAIGHRYINPDKKVKTWFKRFYKCWCDDLCALFDLIPAVYGACDAISKNTWKYIGFDTPEYLLEERRDGDLTTDYYLLLRERGKIGRVTNQINRIERFAFASEEEVSAVFREEKDKEEIEFEKLCRKTASILKHQQDKQIWIYGAGTDGTVLLSFLEDEGIRVSGFIDRRANDIKGMDGYPVISLSDIHVEESLVVVPFRRWRAFTLKPLLDLGIDNERIYYMWMRENISAY